jgi:hypothetical protein
MKCGPVEAATTRRLDAGTTASAQLGTLLAVLLLASACGTTEPEPMKTEVTADLCATVPAALREGLIANSITVRVSSLPPGKPPAMNQAKGMLERVLGSVAGDS